MKITIFWFAWSGTSTIWKLLSERLDYKFMSSWNIMREWAKDLGLNIYDFENEVVKNDNSFDIKLDNKVLDFWINNDNFIFESRLAWYFIPDSFKIYLKCEDIERYDRIHKRELINIDEVLEKTQKRENDLISRYAKIYPNISFPPHEDIFDLVIDVTKISPLEITDFIMKKILLKYMY